LHQVNREHPLPVAKFPRVTFYDSGAGFDAGEVRDQFNRAFNGFEMEITSAIIHGLPDALPF